jgi:multiple sugar transport system permease protein
MANLAPAIRLGGAAAGRRHGLWDSLRGHLKGSEYLWALAFVIPYLAVFVVFVAYPIVYGLWMGHDPALYKELFADPIYANTVVNTLIYLAVGVNVKMFLAFLLSGFFVRPGWWVKILLVIFVLPWAVPALPTFISIHWMLDGQWGLLNNLLWKLFGINGPFWLDSRWMAMGAMTGAYIWKYMPFWTVIFIAGRMAIAPELYEAAAVDGATGLRRFVHITFPLLATLYFVNTLLSTIFSVGDFATPFFITNGGPALTTYTLANLGIRNAFDLSDPNLGVACVMSALPLMIPLVIFLMRKLRTMAVEQ